MYETSKAAKNQWKTSQSPKSPVPSWRTSIRRPNRKFSPHKIVRRILQHKKVQTSEQNRIWSRPHRNSWTQAYWNLLDSRHESSSKCRTLFLRKWTAASRLDCPTSINASQETNLPLSQIPFPNDKTLHSQSVCFHPAKSSITFRFSRRINSLFRNSRPTTNITQRLRQKQLTRPKMPFRSCQSR